jgi:hypothetical protein
MKTHFAVILTSVLMLSPFASAGVDSSGGSSPFTYSGEILQTVFSSPLVWRKVFGSVEQLTRLSQSQTSAVYQLSTTEPVPVKNANGATIRWDQVPCTTVITVTNVATAPMMSKLEVTDVDFSKCPAIKTDGL